MLIETHCLKLRNDPQTLSFDGFWRRRDDIMLGSSDTVGNLHVEIKGEVNLRYL